MATVNAATATINVPDKVTCSFGGSSVPIVVTSTAAPFADVKVSLEASTTKDGDKTTNNSEGITPNTGEVVTLSVNTASGTLGFKCAAAVKGKELKYKKDGTDKAQFTLSSATVAVTAQKAGTKPAKPAMKVAMVADKSKAAATYVEGECPGMGNSWIHFMPRAWGAAPLAAAADVVRAFGKFSPSAGNLHEKDQWCSVAVAAAGGKTACTF